LFKKIFHFGVKILNLRIIFLDKNDFINLLIYQKMSIIGIKDIDYKISSFLKNNYIFTLSHVNTYYFKLFDEKYWKNKLVKEHRINFYNEPWKFYYFIVEKNLKDGVIESVESVINENRPDILKFIFTQNEYDKTFSTFLITSEGAFSAPFDISIKNGSLECFKYLVSIVNPSKHSYSYFLSSSLIYKKLNITEFLLEKIKLKRTHIQIGLNHNYVEFFTFINYEHIQHINVYNVLSCTDISKKNWASFQIFILKFPSFKIFEYKMEALRNNRDDVSNLLS
jgi:hypothetical protein